MPSFVSAPVFVPVPVPVFVSEPVPVFVFVPVPVFVPAFTPRSVSDPCAALFASWGIEDESIGAPPGVSACIEVPASAFSGGGNVEVVSSGAGDAEWTSRSGCGESDPPPPHADSESTADNVRIATTLRGTPPRKLHIMIYPSCENKTG